MFSVFQTSERLRYLQSKKAPKIDAPGVMDVWWPVTADILFFASCVFEINSFWFTSLTQTYQIRQQPLLLGELKNANILYGIWCRRPRGLHLVRGRLRASLLDVRRGVARQQSEQLVCPDFRQTETFDVIITLQHGLCLSAHKTLFLCVRLVFVKISKCFDSLLNALTKCGTTTTDRNANSIATDFFLLCLLIPFSRFFSPVHLSGFHHVLYSLFISPFPHYISFPFFVIPSGQVLLPCF